MKYISALKNTAGLVLLAGLMLGITGFVHAQTSGSGQTGGAMSGQGGSTSGPGGAMSGQGGSTSGEAITGQRNSQGDGTTDTTGKGTSGKDDSYSMSPRKKGSGVTGQGAGSSSSQGTGSSGGSSGSGSGGY